MALNNQRKLMRPSTLNRSLSSPYMSRRSLFCLDETNPLRRASLAIISWPWFERFSLLMITLNCIGLGMVDPCDAKCVKQTCQILQKIEHFIFAFFAIEMLLKMVALGVFGKHSYLGETWNRFDCFIVLVGTVEYAFVDQDINLSAIRAIRVLRPLRAINRISSLRLLVTLLLDIMPMLGNVLIFCFFLFVIFGIVAVQLWAGLLRHRCFFPAWNSSTTKPPWSFMPSYYRPPNTEFVCSTSFGALRCNKIEDFEQQSSMCLHRFANNATLLDLCRSLIRNYTECRADGPNPARGTVSFDNIGYAWIVIFQIISLETWSEIMYLVQDGYSFWAWIYFVALVMLGSYLAVNLCLVVIATQFSETKARERERMRMEQRRFSVGKVSNFSAASKSLYTQLIDLIGHLLRVLLRTTGIQARWQSWRLRRKSRKRFEQLLNKENEHCPSCRRRARQSSQQAVYEATLSTAQCRMCGHVIVMHQTWQQRLGETIEKNRTTVRLCLQHNVTTAVTMTAILINAAIMAVEHHGQPPELTTFIETMNAAFTFIFTMELIMKFYAHGPKAYFSESFNTLDTIIISINLAEVFHSHGGSGLAVLRLFRLVRLVKIIRFLPALQKQLLVMLRTVDHVATFFFLLSFFLYIAALLGMSLFGCKFCEAVDQNGVPLANLDVAHSHNDDLAPTVLPNVTEKDKTCLVEVTEWTRLNDTLMRLMHGTNNQAQHAPLTLYRCSLANFDSLFESVFTVLQVFTQDSWAQIMQDGMHYTSDWAGIYFIVLVTIGNYIIFNLLIAILVEAFSSQNDDDCVDQLDPFLYGSNASLYSLDDTHEVAPIRQQQGSLRSSFKSMVSSNKSLGFFTKRNIVRRLLLKLFNCTYYDRTLLAVIIGNCTLMMLERPSIPHDSLERLLLSSASYIFTAIFALEALFKIIAFGLIYCPKAYLRSGWNILDSFLVVIALIDLTLELLPTQNANLLHQTLRVVCLLRALRPLRIISRAQGLQVVIKTLMLSIKPIGNIVFICCFFFGIFSILGVQLFSGCFSRCVIPTKQHPHSNATSPINDSYTQWAAMAIDSVETKADCVELGFVWYRERFNFDSLPNALMALFVFSTLDGWSAITHNGAACVGVDRQPMYGYNPWAYVYFASFLVIVCFFILNMFVGVVVNNFQKVQKQIDAEARKKVQEIQAAALLNRLAMRNPRNRTGRRLSTTNVTNTLLAASTSLVQTMGMRVASKDKPAAEDDDNPEEQFWLDYPPWRLSLYNFCTSRYFEFAVIIAAAFNTFIMAVEYYHMPPILHSVFTWVGYVFLFFVIAEIGLKIGAFGFKRYVSDRWNQADVIVALISIFTIIVDEIDIEYLPVNPSLVRTARVFRIVRAFKLLKSASGLRRLMETIGKALPHVIHLSLLFILLFFVYASLGVQLFGNFKCSYEHCLGLSRHANFYNFGVAMLTLFRIFTGDSWNEILKDVLWITADPERCDASVTAIPCKVVYILAPVYFISFVLVTQFVLINIVVAALLNQLNDSSKHPASANEAVRNDALQRVERIEREIEQERPKVLAAIIEASPGVDEDEIISVVSTEYVLQQPVGDDQLALARPSSLHLLFNREAVCEAEPPICDESNAYRPRATLNRQKRTTVINIDAASPSPNLSETDDTGAFEMTEQRNSSSASSDRPSTSANNNNHLVLVDEQALQRAIEAISEEVLHNAIVRRFPSSNRLLSVSSQHVASTSADATNNSLVTAYVEIRRSCFRRQRSGTLSTSVTSGTVAAPPAAQQDNRTSAAVLARTASQTSSIHSVTTAQHEA